MLRRFESDELLAMPLMRLEVERAMVVETCEVSIVRMAAVALENVADEEEKHHVDHRRSEENRVGGDDVVEVPSDSAGDKSDNDDRDAEPLRKIFANKELLARAQQAGVNTSLRNGAFGNGEGPPAPAACDGRRGVVKFDAARLVAFGADKGNVHFADFTARSGLTWAGRRGAESLCKKDDGLPSDAREDLNRG